MILKSQLKEVAEAQKENLQKLNTGLIRHQLDEMPELASHTLIISGIRRCGKSTLLHQLLKERHPNATYLNFEDPRLYEFELNDFTRLDELIRDRESTVLFFDEIQVVEGWERYIRQKLDEGFKIVITGSNASLLSSELGSKLTGRHITKELFPFSWIEFCEFRSLEYSEDTLKKYMETGGFPEYVKTEDDDILHQLFEDILVRDIAVRYGVRDVKTLKRLALYLVSNVGNLVTGNKLKSLFGIGATSTVMEYFSYLEQTWLMHFIPKFSYSVRKQSVNPRKVYAIDNGLINVNSKSFSGDYGRILENLVFLHLRRSVNEIYYFSENGECDFVTFNKGKVNEVVQVCYELNPDNLDRELNGLFEALSFFELNEGTIITLNQADTFETEGFTARVVPCHEYFCR
ncbi:MAG: AAA family ATPase [Bacteroidetes bacterium]|jgi:predicted AAA+ superfamily ATPase|nr:AAA family ATPase [Bacteroidota bacterium]